MSDGTAAVSLQVLQEYYAVATRKSGLAPDLAQERVRVFGEGRVVCFEVSDLIAVIELHRFVHISFWDALIVHAARSWAPRCCTPRIYRTEESLAASGS